MQMVVAFTIRLTVQISSFDLEVGVATWCSVYIHQMNQMNTLND